MVGLVVFLIVAAAVAGILIYRNNKKKADAIITKVEDAADKVANTATTVVSDVKKA